MTTEVKNAYVDYVELGEKIKELTDLRKKAQAKIQKHHVELGLDLICEDGFKSQVIPQTTKTLDKALLIQKFGEEAVNECYVTGTKMNFRCERLILG